MTSQTSAHETTQQLPESSCESSASLHDDAAGPTWQPGQELSSATAHDVAAGTEQLPQPGAGQLEPSLQSSGQTNGCEPPPPVPHLVVTDQAVPFQGLATDPDEGKAGDVILAGDVLLAGYEAPKSATTPAYKSSAVYFSTEAGTLLHPVNPGQNMGEELDEMKLISAFHKALSMACKAGKALQVRSEEKRCEVEGAHAKEHNELSEESKDFNEKYAELKQYEQHLKGAYERECDELREQLREMTSKQKEHDRDHESVIETLLQKHCAEKRELKEQVALQADCLEFQSLQQKQADVAKLKKLKKNYQEGCKEAEDLCTQLAEKEKSLYTLRCRIENLEMTLKRHLLSVSEDHIKQQLQTCRQIEKMVERLPNVSGAGIDKLVAEISAQVDKMRSLSNNKRSTSWRR